MNTDWWKNAVIYEIYPRSFQDSNDDGIGDLQGIISRLDYIKKLGADAIWLCPVYPSPNVDFGYDVTNHQDISEEYGTMEDMEKLIKEAHDIGLRVILDIVYNHTSDQHPLFQEARKSRNNRYRDYYHWRPGTEGGPPTDWISTYGSPAWTFDEQTGEYYLHMNSKRQIDLNWDNPEVREGAKKMMIFWAEKGVDGFRIDQLGHINKKKSLPPCEDFLKKSADPKPKIIKDDGAHPYIHQLNEEVFSPYHLMTVGESGETTPEDALLYTDPDRKEVNMIFSMKHLQLDQDTEHPLRTKPLILRELKDLLNIWQKTLEEKGWNTLFWNNHDQPRIVSKYGDDGKYRIESAKMLAASLYLMKGTPFIFQGEELGMTNGDFNSIDDFRDSQAKTLYNRLYFEKGQDRNEIVQGLQKNGRDNARTPMQWDDSNHAGFTKAEEPWIKVNKNYKDINVKQALEDKNSVFWFYHDLFKLRKEYPQIILGGFKMLLIDHPDILLYIRTSADKDMMIICNYRNSSSIVNIEDEYQIEKVQSSKLLLGNYTYSEEELTSEISLKPFETRIYLIEKRE